MSAGVEYTIDELARAAGTTVRSVRVYHERGVLPPPQVKGRTGFYGPEHLNRVQTISRLLDRGIKLNGIKELLAAWDRGDNLGDVLGVPAAPPISERSDSDDSDSRGELIAATQLQDQYGAVPDGLAKVVAAGLYEPVDATNYRVADREMIGATDRLIATGVPMAEVFDELAKLRSDCERISRRFIDLWDRSVWHAFRQSERTATDLALLTEQLEAIRAVPGQMAAALVNRFIARTLGQDYELDDVLSGH